MNVLRNGHVIRLGIRRPKTCKKDIENLTRNMPNTFTWDRTKNKVLEKLNKGRRSREPQNLFRKLLHPPTLVQFMSTLAMC
jgi:hypothetical protein